MTKVTSRLFSTILLCLLALPGWAAPDYQLRLESPKTTYFLGESVLLDFQVVNTGKEPLEVEFGGDYRGSPRATRFSLEAFDEQGKLLEDPWPQPLCFGGLSHRPRLKPGEIYHATLALHHYRRVRRGGRLKIKATHDLGRKNQKWATIQLQFQEPTPAQAQQVLSQMLDAPKWQPPTAGKPTPLYQDFQALAYSVYLEPLRNLGGLEAVEGIGQIPGDRATHALLELASKHPQAVERLVARTPVTEETGNWEMTQREHLATQSWGEDNIQAARQLGLQLIQQPQESQAILGAKLLWSFGRPQELPAILDQLDKVLPAVWTYPRPGSLAFELERTLQHHLRTQVIESRPVDSNSNAAQILLRVLDQPLDQELELALDSRAARVRELAIQRLPSTSPRFSQLEKYLNDPDPGVQIAACERLNGHPQMIYILQTRRDEWVLRAAANSAGDRAAAIRALLPRLAEPERFNQIFVLILNLALESSSGHSSNGVPKPQEIAQLQKRWLDYLGKNAASFKTGLKALPAPLIPSTYKIH